MDVIEGFSGRVSCAANSRGAACAPHRPCRSAQGSGMPRLNLRGVHLDGGRRRCSNGSCRPPAVDRQDEVHCARKKYHRKRLAEAHNSPHAGNGQFCHPGPLRKSRHAEGEKAGAPSVLPFPLRTSVTRAPLFSHVERNVERLNVLANFPPEGNLEGGKSECRVQPKPYTEPRPLRAAGNAL